MSSDATDNTMRAARGRVMGFLKRLFCLHRGGVAFVRNIHGDEINRSGGKRSIWLCKRCGGFIFEPYLNQPSADVTTPVVKKEAP